MRGSDRKEVASDSKRSVRNPLVKNRPSPPKSIDEDAPPEMIAFEGFTPETFRFLHALKKQNNKPWFEAHRNQYEETLREPSRALVQTMGQLFLRYEMPFVADARRSLFRINRDIRFSKDKSPYKTHIGISFPLAGAAKGFEAGLYVGFEPEGAKGIRGFVGGGVYQPQSDQLKSIRQKISRDFRTFSSLVSEKSFRKEFPEGIKGESLKRMPLGFLESDPASGYLKMKQFLFGSSLEIKDLLDENLPDKLLKKFKAAQPVALYLGT